MEAGVELSKMTENCAAQNASSGAVTGAAASNEERAGWMWLTKVANLTVESEKKTEKGARTRRLRRLHNKMRAAVLQLEKLPATGKEQDG